ncbi:MAG: dihydrofolate reductase family protein [Chloroflexota bacterium]
MAKLIYSALASVDGYIADEQGDFSWAAPDEELHAAVNDLERDIGTMLLGRRMYQVLSAWETMDVRDEPAVIGGYAAIWHSIDKVVYSTTLAEVSTGRTTLERVFDPQSVQARKASADRDLSIGGPTLAALAFRAGLVDEVQLFLVPEVVGGGLAALPPGSRASLQLVDERRFAGGAVLLRYRVVG